MEAKNDCMGRKWKKIVYSKRNRKTFDSLHKCMHNLWQLKREKSMKNQYFCFLEIKETKYRSNEVTIDIIMV